MPVLSLRTREIARKATVFGKEAAAHYEAWYETPEGRRADLLEKAALQQVLQHFPQVRSVLEVGCGTGHFTRWLHEQGLVAVGLDISTAMLAQAQTLGGSSLVRGDAIRLPFDNGAFDLTALVTTLEFLGRPQAVLAEALRVSRHGLLLGVLNRWSALGVWRRLAGCFRPTVYDAARFYGVGELARLLRSVTQGTGHLVWHTTLFPRWWPFHRMAQPWGGFIAMALKVEKMEKVSLERRR
ncbi:MAG: class I SAM-dependent methyltransferase [Anaerolineae bacterium]